MVQDAEAAAFVAALAAQVIDDTAKAVDQHLGSAAGAAFRSAPSMAAPRARGDDFIEQLMPALLPRIAALDPAVGRPAALALVQTVLARVLRAFGEAARQESDGSVADRVRRILAPIPPDTLAIVDWRAAADDASFQVTGCRYAETMQRLGAADIGKSLICDLDHAIAEGLGLVLERTGTLMQGASACDFRYRDKEG